MSAHTYSDNDATRAVQRHSRRTVFERLALLRAILCDAAHDSTPSYSGVEENGAEFNGPPVWATAIEQLAYFVASSQTKIGDVGDAEKAIETIMSHVRRGCWLARHHSLR